MNYLFTFYLKSNLTNDNLLLSGASLKIASSIYGCVVYAGQDKKMMINSKFKPTKLSCVERRMNYYIAVDICLIFLIALLCMVGSFSYSNIYTKHWYLAGYGSDNQHLANFITFMSYVNLSALIPISLYVTLGKHKLKVILYIYKYLQIKFFNLKELTKTIGANFFQWDKE